METLNVLNNFHTNELIYKEQIYLHKKIVFLDEPKVKEFVLTLIQNHLYKYINQIQKRMPNNIFINKIKQANLFSSLNNHLFNTHDFSIHELNSLVIEKMITYRLGETDSIYKVKKFIVLLFLEDYIGNLLINDTVYSNNTRGTLFMIPYSFIFTIAFDRESTSTVLITYISENIKKKL